MLAMQEDKKQNWNGQGDLSESESEQIMNIINKEGDRELQQLQQSMQYSPMPSVGLSGQLMQPEPSPGMGDGGDQIIDGGSQVDADGGEMRSSVAGSERSAGLQVEQEADIEPPYRRSHTEENKKRSNTPHKKQLSKN